MECLWHVRVEDCLIFIGSGMNDVLISLEILIQNLRTKIKMPTQATKIVMMEQIIQGLIVMIIVEALVNLVKQGMAGRVHNPRGLIWILVEILTVHRN